MKAKFLLSLSCVLVRKFLLIEDIKNSKKINIMSMEIFFVIAIVGIILMSCIAFFVGKKLGNNGDDSGKVLSLESRIVK